MNAAPTASDFPETVPLPKAPLKMPAMVAVWPSPGSTPLAVNVKATVADVPPLEVVQSR